jgi:hypothetical protein
MFLETVSVASNQQEVYFSQWPLPESGALSSVFFSRALPSATHSKVLLSVTTTFKLSVTTYSRDKDTRQIPLY